MEDHVQCIASCLKGIGFSEEPARARMVVICDKVLGKRLEMGGAFPNILTAFAEEIMESDLPAAMKVGYFWLGIAGKYLPVYPLERLTHYLSDDSGSNGLLRLLARELKRDSQSVLTDAPVRLEHANADVLLIDVTHTESYPTLSGVQRVVRSTIAELERAGQPYRLIRMDSAMQTFEFLSLEEKQAFLNFRPRDNKSVSLTGKYDVLRWRRGNTPLYEVCRISFRLLLLLLGNTTAGPIRESRIIGALFRMKDAMLASLFRGRRTRRRTTTCHIVPLLFDSCVALLEVALDEYVSRIDMYLAMNSAFRQRIGMICYDLVPILQPEYCVVSGPFTNYLRLLRVASSVSCISQYSERSFSKFLEMIDHRTDLRVAAHALAGDFKANGDPPVTQAGEPVILCVGTIEPRKNQLGTLRAAKLLWKAGLSFKLIFAGNLGWLYQQFMEEFHEAVDEGYNVHYVRGPSEATLRSLYSSCTFTVFCSFFEGAGLPVLESMNYGKPCVTSRITSLQEIADQGGCIAVDPYSVGEMAEAMRTLLVDPAIREKLQLEIARHPQRTWEEYARELYAFFTQA